MAWLDDDELRSGLTSQIPSAWIEAAEALLLRTDVEGPLNGMPRVDEALLTVLSRDASYSETSRIVSLLFELSALSPPPITGTATGLIAVMVGSSLHFDAMHAAAMELKIRANPGSVVAGVLAELEGRWRASSRDRRAPIEHFLTCLMDGSPEVRAATQDATRRWASSPQPRSSDAVMVGAVHAMIAPCSGLVTLSCGNSTATMDYFAARSFEGSGPLVRRLETWLIFIRKHLKGEDV